MIPAIVCALVAAYLAVAVSVSRRTYRRQLAAWERAQATRGLRCDFKRFRKGPTLGHYCSRDCACDACLYELPAPVQGLLWPFVAIRRLFMPPGRSTDYDLISNLEKELGIK